MRKYNISPSLMKDYFAVESGDLCGAVFQAKHIKKIITFEPSESKKAGQWAEYMMTGATLRDGTTPEPVRVKNGDLNTQYERLEKQAKHWKNWCKHNGVTDIQTGVVLSCEFGGYTIKGIADVVCNVKGKKTIIDIKTSGLIDNKWDPMGWEDIERKESLTIQAPVYKWLWKQIHGEDVDFFFYVAHINHDSNRKIFHMEVTDKRFERLEKTILYIIDSIQVNEELGWGHTNNFEECIVCQIGETCPYRLWHPKPKTVILY